MGKTIVRAIAPGVEIKFPDPDGNVPVFADDDDNNKTVKIAIAPGAEMEFPDLDFSDVDVE
ncbi:MAG: hypothetical protein A2271_01180 [Candidatus Moranbacteria bacterium RIFOXYA12_FULL_35_19]|nr:MAG: hypothetical protein UR78_C0005G0004 [Candidatus Moranbacteria bacterium GW2011_GWF2_35_39]OGI30652.1 MAG: hypothetical protein A2343_03660 [Candidatus Moranbacteria bacterium RIFOXYB12_FULL_35_8]OGI33244.1 MAG: hypothetical protein A2489_01085 [Candidatus Moranbacteria bacterium RIFOXYC12_FULL_36_13]OGI36509.1 MAG: hypothetical protein A2271_01180 [Candidatus Moranbacteria bacterium RIFOXYA12_FULL_35_19]